MDRRTHDSRAPQARLTFGVRSACALLFMVASFGLAACSNDAGRPPGSSGGTAPATSGASSSSTATAKSAASVTVLAGGDDIPQQEIIAQAKKDAGGDGYNFLPQLQALKPLVSKADLAICQMEGALTTTDTNLTTGIRHNGPHEFATALKDIGYDGCSLANNHTFDNGLAGLTMTREIMKENGLQAAGPRATADGPEGQPAWYNVNGFKIAQLSYSYTLDNCAEGCNTGFPSAAPWLKDNLYYHVKAEGIAADAKKARAEGADLVFVSMHWGSQFKFPVNADVQQMAHDIAQTGQVDWIIGNHPHLVQGCEKVDNTIINYAMGNQLSNQGVNWGFPKQTQDGVSVELTFTRDAAGKISVSGERYQPTWVDRLHGYRTYIVPKTGAPAAVDPDSWSDTTKQLSSMGDSCQLTPMS